MCQIHLYLLLNITVLHILLQADIKARDLSSWLEQRRNQRANSRRLAEEERIDKEKLEAEEKARLELEQRERERKAQEEAEAKKKKKKGKGKGKK